MGQYYEPMIMDGTEVTMYNREVNGEYGMAKLMEHSWVANPCVAKVCGAIYQHPCKIAWVGDYVENDWIPNTPFTGNMLWKMEAVEIKSPQIYLSSVVHESHSDKLLVNHSKKLIINGKEYIERNTKDDWCVHPLPLLTACGNGRGGGDYHGSDMDYVGEWAGDLISVEEATWKVPEGYEYLLLSFSE